MENYNMKKNITTSEKLMFAAIDLISEKGYDRVTTMEIATEAGLSEKTLFRHFGSKQNLLETAFHHFHYTEEMRYLFNEKIVWDLQTDLLLISQTYHKIMNRNRKMIQIAIKEGGHLPGFRERTKSNAMKLLEFITNYFNIISEKCKLQYTEPEKQSFAFMMMHFGAFINDLNDEINFPTISLEDFIVESVNIFTSAYTP